MKYYLLFSLCFTILLSTVVLCNGNKLESECDFHVTVIRQLEKDGFHREIHSLVELVGGYGIIQRQHCSLAVRETLPSGLYVNPDQLEDLARLGQVQACADGFVDVEAPEPLSTNLTVMVYSSLERAEGLVSAQLVLPIHARYHEAAPDGGYQPITIGSPELFLRCAGHLTCPHMNTLTLPCYACSEELCTWMQISYKTNAESLTMLVPVGNMQHSYLVSVLTFTITTGGAIYILSVLATSAANLS